WWKLSLNLFESPERAQHDGDTSVGAVRRGLSACRGFVMILGHAARSLGEHGTIGSVTLQDSAFLRACRRQPVPHTPVWFMRQAGRSLPEYRKLREGVAMLDACARPDMIVEITLQPVRRYNVDAAIFFSDIMVPVKAIGVDLDIKPSIGPVVAHPVRDPAGVRQLRGLEPDDVWYVT